MAFEMAESITKILKANYDNHDCSYTIDEPSIDENTIDIKTTFDGGLYPFDDGDQEIPVRLKIELKWDHQRDISMEDARSQCAYTKGVLDEKLPELSDSDSSAIKVEFAILKGAIKTLENTEDFAEFNPLYRHVVNSFMRLRKKMEE